MSSQALEGVVEDTVESTELVSTTEAQQRAEIDVQIATAKKYPRQISRFEEDVKGMVLKNAAVARTCMYAVPRGGKKIEGASVRFAELLASTWGNCRVASRIVEVGEESVTVQGVFQDVQRNVVFSSDVTRGILKSDGTRFKEDMVINTINAASAIARRNATLQGVPRPLWEPIYREARGVAAGIGKSIDEKRANMYALCAEGGVDKKQLHKYLNIRSESDVDIETMIFVAGVVNAAEQDGCTLKEMFEIESAELGTQQNVTASPLNNPPPEDKSSGSASDASAAPTKGELFSKDDDRPQGYDND